ncbi:MAG: O-antigen ligase family protein [Solirubrobacteraceae bacterium]
MSAHAGPVERFQTSAAARVQPGLLLGGGVALVLAATSFGAGGGLVLGPETTIEIGLTLLGALVVVAAIATGGQAPIYGAAAFSLLAALAALTAASVIWSVQPADSWNQASRVLAYTFTFAAAMALARLAPERWRALLGGVIGGAVLVCAYAVLTKVFPGALNAGETYARLREPYGYWNAIGLTAALGVPPLLWLGARRTGHGALSGLAFPATTLLLLTLLLAYSRGALLALALGLAFWFATVPLRLRGLLVLGVGGLSAAPLVAWAFSQHALSADNVPLGERLVAGHRFGVLVLLVLLLSLLVGLAARFTIDSRPRSAALRRQAGLAALAALALLPVLAAGALALSSRGVSGSITHTYSTLTDPHAAPPSNDPTRLTAIGSARARYWNDALKIFKDHPTVGVGAAGYPTARARYRSDRLEVQHAHGYVVQTLADLGIVGLALSLLGVGALLFSAICVASPFGWRAPPGSPYSEERIGLLTLLAIVIVFGTHSAVDWTWEIPGDAIVALLCGGWLAGRGPHTLALPRSLRRPSLARSPARAAAAALTLAVALLVAWAQWQPLRSQHTASSALNALAAHDYRRAIGKANSAAAINPLSIEPLFDLSTIQLAAGNSVAARAALERAVRLQPANPATWTQLAQFEIGVRHDRSAALRDLGAALYLDPQSGAGVSQYLDTLRLQSTPPASPLTPAANGTS